MKLYHAPLTRSLRVVSPLGDGDTAIGRTSRFLRILSGIAGRVFLALVALAPVAHAVDRVVIAWDDDSAGTGRLQAFEAELPFAPASAVLEVGALGRVRHFGDRLYHISRSAGVVSVIDPGTFQVEKTFQIPSVQDIAVTGPDTAYVTRSSATALLRLDLVTGQTAEAVDLAIHADSDGNPDMRTLIAHAGRLYVQLRRADGNLGVFDGPLLAVIDIASETLVDVDPVADGVQSIALRGTGPRFKMQVVPETRRLFLSSTGNFHDYGGIEMIDLDNLASLGLVVQELVDEVGADLGAFVFTDAGGGWLSFSTDLLLSAHLHAFTLAQGVNANEVQTTLFFFTPHLLHDPNTDYLYWLEPNGFRVFDASSSASVSVGPIALSGEPTDLEMVPSLIAVPVFPVWGTLAFGFALLGWGVRRLRQ